MSDLEPRSLLIQGVKELGIRLTENQIDQFEKFRIILEEWNRKLNLTAVRHAEDIVIKHFLDSLTLFPHLPKVGMVKDVIDVGTGAGFPGIPMGILRPDLSITLLDAKRKKVQFLEEAVQMLPENQFHPLWARAEDLIRTHAIHFDVVVARALGELEETLRLTLPLAKKSGVVLLQRGPKDDSLRPTAETFAHQFDCRLHRLIILDLPLSHDRRRIWVFKKAVL